MAVPARPGPSDVRVPCPLCGGLIHPIAGKCKHCKADLSGHRGSRPAASAPLPALAPTRSPDGPSGGLAEPGAAPAGARDLHGPGAPRPSPTGAGAGAGPPGPHGASVAAAPDAAPVLPRPRGHTAEPAASSWRSWPVMVIVLAALAIVAAVVLMIWPGSERAGSPAQRALQPPPAPEHMPTAPAPVVPDRRSQLAPPAAPKAAVPDPWQPDTATPPAPSPIDPPAPDGDDAQDAEDDTVDLSALDPTPGAPAGRPSGPAPSSGVMVAAMVARMCNKMAECNVIDSAMSDLCVQIANHPAPLPANCPAAARCLQHIDEMSCGSHPSSVRQLALVMTQVRDCTDAARC